MAPLAAETDVAQEQRLPMTYEEFLASELSEAHAEWVDGEVIVFMPPSERHADILLFLASLFSDFAQALLLGKVFVAPFEMRLPKSSREPDVLFVAQEHLDRLDGRRVNGPADLVVEIISDSSVARDRAHKFYEYEEAGIPEYLLIDPRVAKERVELHRLGADRKYHTAPPDATGRLLFTTLPGFWLEESWLWQDPLPRAFTVFAQIAPEQFGGVAGTQQ